MRSDDCQSSSPCDNRYSQSSAFQPSPLHFANNESQQEQQSRQNVAAMAAAKLMLELNFAKFVADGHSQQSQSFQLGANPSSTASSPTQVQNPAQQLSPPLAALFSSSPTGAINQIAMNHFATNGNAMDSNAVSPLLFPPIYPHKFNERKRRRIIGNLDNTLDGLVAKRVDVDAPLKKRYQTETEAIELPDDEIETKRMETDPDVSTRMCSVCGYQGKWVSEMIRHKRVHTSDRPFKCKYCNRTSKWKADLIRHVAKTHGIRVVSKYSRSKAFEGNTADQIQVDDNNNEEEDFGHSDENNNKPLPTTNSVARKAHRLSALARNNRLVQRQMHNHESDVTPNNLVNNNHFKFFCHEAKSPQSVRGSPLGTVASTYRCLTCSFEQESFSVLVAHLHAVHDQSPFHCTHCQRTFEEVGAVTEHYQPTGHHSCPSFALKLKFAIVSGGGRNGSQLSPLLPPPFSFGQMLQHKSPALPFASGFFASLPQPTTTTMFGPSPTLSAHSSTSSSAFSTSSMATVAGEEGNDDVQLVTGDGGNTKVAGPKLEKEDPEIIVDFETTDQKAANGQKIAKCIDFGHGQRSTGSMSPISVFEMPIDLTLNDQHQQPQFSVAATTTSSPARMSPVGGGQMAPNNLALLLAAIQPNIAAANAYKRNIALSSVQIPTLPPFAVALQQLSAQNPLAALNFCSSLLELQKKSTMAT